MAQQALYRKWRPQTFDEVVGQEHVIHTLRNALTSGRIHHAYLFAGPRGTGKTTTARLLAKAVNCLAPEDQRPCNRCAICQAVNEGRLLDLIEIDAASNTGVDDVRELRERIGLRPNEARYKVYVIDEAHMLSNAAFNALLKTLEEPPPHAIIVLATTRPDKILDTVLSRCQRFDFRRIPLDKVVARLAWIVEQEHVQIDPQVLTLIARQSTGCMRDAESLLDQLVTYDEKVTVEEARAALGIGATADVVQVTEALASRDVAQGLNAINAAVDEGADVRQFARQIVEHLRVLLLLRLGAGVVSAYASEEMRPQLEKEAAAFPPQVLARAVRLFNQAATEATERWQPQLPLEMAFIEAVLSADREDQSPPHSPDPTRARSLPSSRHSASLPQQPSASALSRSTLPAASTPPARRMQEPAPAYSTPAPADSPSRGDGEATPEVLRRRWAEFLDALRPRNLPLEALMRSCEPVAVEGDVIVLSFVHDFHRGKLEEERNKQDVEDVLSELIGRRYRVRCVLNRQESAAAPQARPVTAKRLTPAGPPGPSTSETATSATSLSPEQIIAQDPVVRAAVEDLGAQIMPHHET